MMLVATLGKMPRFLFLFFSLSGSSSSPVLGEATLLSRPSPAKGNMRFQPDLLTSADSHEHKQSRIHSGDFPLNKREAQFALGSEREPLSSEHKE